MKRSVIFLMICSMLISFASFLPSAQAGSGWDYTVDISSKFGRGLTNILTGPVEIPCNMAEEMETSTYKGLAVGIGKGLYKMARRMFNGVTEIATFMIPGPADMPYVCQGRDERQAAAAESAKKSTGTV